MLFSSMNFLWIFLPTVLIINFLLGLIPSKNNLKLKNVFLLFASFLFYAWGGINYLLIMLFVILLNYFCGILLLRYEQFRKPIIVTDIIGNLLILGYFKYFNLILSSIEKLAGIEEIVLPIGISFFVFQAMSYSLDAYWKKTKVQKNLLDFALYVSLFPQLIAGPIVQYKDIESQLNSRTESIEKTVYGIKRFSYGLGKKVLIANTLGAVVDEIWALELSEIGFGVAFMGALFYTLQIYYDFSGYSDMAIGIGKMLGFDFKENFNYPYTSFSIKEFWRRWHISLSSWFRDYVYIPLGGNRISSKRTYLNLIIVLFLTGIWHGANYTFFAWGLYYAFFIVLERAFLGKALDKNPIKCINWIYTMLVVVTGWIFFRAPSISSALSFLKAFGNFHTSVTVLNYLSMKTILAFIFGVLLSGPLQRLLRKPYEKIQEHTLIGLLDFLIQITLIILSIFMLISSTYNPFIYFQF